MNPVFTIVVGDKAEATMLVTEEVTINHFHADMPKVFTTPFMIYLMEVAAAKAIKPSLPKGWVSVGVGVNIRHLAPTPIGRTVTAQAWVTKVTDKWITFKVQAHDGKHLIGKGTHTRAAVNLERFNETLASQEP